MRLKFWCQIIGFFLEKAGGIRQPYISLANGVVIPTMYEVTNSCIEKALPRFDLGPRVIVRTQREIWKSRKQLIHLPGDQSLVGGIMNTTSLIDTAALLLGPGHPRSVSASLWACPAETLGVERV